MLTHKEIEDLDKHIGDSKPKLVETIVAFVSNSGEELFYIDNFCLRDKMIIDYINNEGVYSAHDDTLTVDSFYQLSELCIEDLLAIYDYIYAQIQS